MKVSEFKFYKPTIEHTVPSEPIRALQIEEVQEVVENALIHPFHTMERVVELLQNNEVLLNQLIQDNLIKRQNHDDTALLGLTLNYQLVYHRHLYVYLYSNVGFTLLVSNGATQVIPANYWSLVNYPAGVYLSVQGGSDTAPILCTFRSCDVPMTPAQQQVLVDNTSIAVTQLAPWTVQQYYVGAPSFVIKEVKQQTITTGTGLSVWTPAVGKKFRLIGWSLYTLTTLASIIFMDTVVYNAANEFIRQPSIGSGGQNSAATPYSLFPFGRLSSAVNNQLWIDVLNLGAGTTDVVDGFVYGFEE